MERLIKSRTESDYLEDLARCLDPWRDRLRRTLSDDSSNRPVLGLINVETPAIVRNVMVTLLEDGPLVHTDLGGAVCGDTLEEKARVLAVSLGVEQPNHTTPSWRATL